MDLSSIYNDSQAKRRFKVLLWGYPDLVKELFEVVGPALAKERDIRKTEGEEAEHQYTTTEHGGNDFLVPEVTGPSQGMGGTGTASISPRSSQSASLDDGSKPSIEMHGDTQSDSQHKPVAPSRTSGEQALLTASGNTGALEPALENPVPGEDDGCTVPHETEGGASMSENTVEGSYKGKLRKRRESHGVDKTREGGVM